VRIAAISDVHGNIFALDAVLEDILDQRVDLVVNLGDHLSGGVAPAETADRLLDTPRCRYVATTSGKSLRTTTQL